MSLLPPGSKLGRFEISTVLGQGAMGVVYLANDPQIDRPVAIKTVRPEAGRGEGTHDIEDRFRKEARLAGRLQHPNIVTIYDVGRDGDVYFIAMEYVDGRPLTRYLTAADELPLTAKIAIIRQTAEALSHAHERGVVHRDIKPGNILVARDGRVKVTDFGIGRFTAASTSDLTRTGQMIGSPAYMSPEQVRGEKLDGRSDLFSLGVVLYELLTAVRPFPGESITTLVYQILHTEPRDPLELKANLPASTREVMARLLAKQPEKRPADAGAFIRELARIERFQRESEVTRRAVVTAPSPAMAEPPPPPPSPPEVPSRTEIFEPPPAATSRATVLESAPPRRVGLLIVVLALAVLALAGILILRERPTGGAVAAPPIPLPAPAPTAAALEAKGVTSGPAPEPSPATQEVVRLPTPGPHEAVDATVGAPRTTGSERPRPAARAPTPPAARPVVLAEAAAPASESASEASSKTERVDAVYATRHGVRFTSSPDQARLTIDGRLVGIADDWDNRGGGREFVFDSPGAHDVRMELPGYKSLHLRIDVSPEAEKDSVSIDDELDRRERVSYEKLPAVYDRTTGAVEFSVEPPDAVVSEGGKALGSASSFGPGSPLTLRGPSVHDLVLAAPGYRPKLVRILVAANAGRDRAHVKEKLKAD
jgi:serine/threonine protein kinase